MNNQSPLASFEKLGKVNRENTGENTQAPAERRRRRRRNTQNFNLKLQN